MEPRALPTGETVDPLAGRLSNRAVKRSMTIRPDIDRAVLQSVGEREYSRFANEALLMALQAIGIEQTVADFETRNNTLGSDDFSTADRRRSEARERTLARLKSLGGVPPSA